MGAFLAQGTTLTVVLALAAVALLALGGRGAGKYADDPNNPQYRAEPGSPGGHHSGSSGGESGAHHGADSGSALGFGDSGGWGGDSGGGGGDSGGGGDGGGGGD